MEVFHVRASGDRWLVVVAAGLAIFMAQLDTTIVNVALPTMRLELGVSAGAIEWVVLGYVVPLIALSLLCGRWLDSSGRRAATTLATTGFGLASIAVAVVPGLAGVIAARVAQGAFASALLAAAPVLAVEAVRADARGRALGIVAALAPLGALAGPTVGGRLVDAIGWRSIFLVNVPVALTVLAVLLTLQDDRPLAGIRRAWVVEAGSIAAAAAIAIGSLSMASSHGPQWLAGTVLACFPLGFWRRSATSQPFRDLVGSPGMRAPHLALLTSYGALLGAQFLIPFFMQQTLRTSAAVVGLTLLAYPAATAVVGLVSGALVDRGSPRAVAVSGAAVLTAGVALLAPLSSGWSPVAVAWRLAIVGVGFGLFVTPTQTVVLTNAGTDRVGRASASTNLARQAGLALGPAVATLAWGLGGYQSGGMRAGLLVDVGLSAATVVAAALFITRRPDRRARAQVQDRSPNHLAAVPHQ
jgi:MFS family permease